MVYICLCIVPIFIAGIVLVGMWAFSTGLLNLRQTPQGGDHSRLWWGIGITGAAILFAYLMGANVRGASYGIQVPLQYVSAEIAGAVLSSVAVIASAKLEGLKVAGLSIFVFPTALLLVYWLGVAMAPDAAFRCDLPLYAQAINEYYQDVGKYPDKIDRTWIRDLNKPYPCPWHAGALGLLYEHNAEGFVVARYSEPKPRTFDHTPLSDMLGPRVCFYDSKVGKVRCEFNRWGPFIPPDQSETHNG